MTMTHDEMIAVIQHHKNGGRVQFRAQGSDGRWFYEYDEVDWNFSAYDYRAAPERRKVWINAYKGGVQYLHNSREEADKYATCDRVACLEAEYEEVQGLSGGGRE